MRVVSRARSLKGSRVADDKDVVIEFLLGELSKNTALMMDLKEELGELRAEMIIAKNTMDEAAKKIAAQEVAKSESIKGKWAFLVAFIGGALTILSMSISEVIKHMWGK